MRHKPVALTRRALGPPVLGLSVGSLRKWPPKRKYVVGTVATLLVSRGVIPVACCVSKSICQLLPRTMDAPATPAAPQSDFYRALHSSVATSGNMSFNSHGLQVLYWPYPRNEHHRGFRIPAGLAKPKALLLHRAEIWEVQTKIRMSRSHSNDLRGNPANDKSWWE